MDFHQVMYPICSVFVAAPIRCVLARRKVDPCKKNMAV